MLIFGTVAGVAIGSVLGLLFAPKTGIETRKDVSKASKKAVEWGKKHTQKFHTGYKDHNDKAIVFLQKNTRRLKARFRMLKKHAVNPAMNHLRPKGQKVIT